MKAKKINEVVIDNHTFYFNENNKMFISATGAISYFNRGKFIKIPQNVWSNATNWGKNFMRALIEKVAYKKPINCFVLEIKNGVDNLLAWCKQNKKKIIGFEMQKFKFPWVGRLDVECKDCFLEIKTRTKPEVNISIVIQCEVYKKICGKKYHVIFINRKNGECKELKPTNEQIKKAQEIIKAIEFIYDILGDK